MKKHINKFMVGLLVIFIGFICYSYFKNNIPRKPYPGFTWKNFSGAGLTLKVQENSSIKFGSNSDTIFIKTIDNKGKENLNPVIKIFDLKDNNINELLSTLPFKNDFKIDASWYSLDNCEFIEIEQNKNAKKFILKPKGKAKTEMDILSPKEPIPFTCAGFGTGNSGMRYFVLFEKMKNKAVFVEIGQDAPLFDENSIKPQTK